MLKLPAHIDPDLDLSKFEKTDDPAMNSDHLGGIDFHAGDITSHMLVNAYKEGKETQEDSFIFSHVSGFRPQIIAIQSGITANSFFISEGRSGK